MTDFAINVFRLSNLRGYSLPVFNMDYTERETGFEWRITCGGTRAYLVRLGTPLNHDLNLQAADSHFMVRRVTSGLLLAGVGLFQADAMGRLLMKDVAGVPVTWETQLDIVDPIDSTKNDDTRIKGILDWVPAICHHAVLRRAADDAHLALTNPHEALVFVYRGLEWLETGLGAGWDQLAKWMGIPFSELREFKKTANAETGVRHATKSGGKMRADVFRDASWVCGLIDAINGARAQLEPGFTPMSAEQVAEVVMRAAPTAAYD